MSLSRLLVVFLVLSSISFAENQARPAEKPPVSNTKSDVANFFTRQQPPTTYNFSLNGRNLRSFAIENPNIGATCYTMRTYVADPNFDKQFVLKAGPDEVSYTPPIRNGAQVDTPLTGTYTTCQPSSQFAVKKAIQTVETGNDGK